MPELPEVETVRRGLIPELEGRLIVKAIQNRLDLRWPLPERFAKRLTGRRVERIRRRGKYLLLDLDSLETPPLSRRVLGQTRPCGLRDRRRRPCHFQRCSTVWRDGSLANRRH